MGRTLGRRASANTPGWPQAGAVLLAAAGAVALAWFGRRLFLVPDPVVLLIVVSAAFATGRPGGLLAAVCGSAYVLAASASPGRMPPYTAEALRQALAWVVTTSVTALAVGALKQRADRVFEIATQNAVLLDRVAERERAARALRESERRQRSMFEDVPVGLLRTSADGRVLDANAAAAKIFGRRDRDEMLAASVDALCIDPEPLRRAVAALADGGDTAAARVAVRRPGGETAWIRVTIRAVRGGARRVTHDDAAAAVRVATDADGAGRADLLVAVVETAGAEASGERAGGRP